MSRSGYLPLDDFTTVTILDSTRSPSLHGAPPAVSASSTPALTGWPGGEAEERSLQVAPPPDQPRVEIFIALRLFRAEDAAAAIIFRPACTLSSGLVFFFFFFLQLTTEGHAHSRRHQPRTTRGSICGVRAKDARRRCDIPLRIIPGYHDEGGGGDPLPKPSLDLVKTNYHENNRSIFLYRSSISGCLI